MSSPILAPPQVVDVTLSLFGGTDTEISPSDLPEGLSPDNQDGVFLPGNWSNRPCLKKLYNPPFPNGVSVVYQKTYVQPNLDPLTLILTSDGKLWVEDVGINPGVPNQLGPAMTPGLYAQSVSAFGREYIAFSDLLHGQGVPLQYDGTNLDRVTQDGPGAPPVATDLAYPTFVISGVGVPGLQLFTSAANITSISEFGTTCTAKLDTPLRMGGGAPAAPGDAIIIGGVGVAGYNITAILTNANGSGTVIQFENPNTGLAASSGGTATLSWIRVRTATNNYIANQSVTIAGATNALYNGQYVIREVVTAAIFDVSPGISQLSLANSGGGTTQQVGMISPGTHQLVQFFITRNGAFTEPSPAGFWTAAGGNKVRLNNLAIGPSNVVARGIGWTGAGGGNFFSILATISLPNLPGPPIVINATIIPDNTSTTADFDFSDNSLFGATPIDVIGNDLFDQVVLGPVMGFFAYASRLMVWGDWNKVENFLNMGFCGGYLSGVLTTPLGWTVATPGGTLTPGGSWNNGMSWIITGDGSANARGQLTQSAYRDSFGDAILSPGTQYLLRIWAESAFGSPAGNIVVDFYDTNTATVLASATIPAGQATKAGGFLQATFTAKTPVVITSTTVLRVYAIGMNNNNQVALGEAEIVFSVNPYRNTLARASYVLNPEAFAQTTGNLGAADDQSPIQNFSLQRNVGLLHTGEATHEFVDNNSEPGDGNNAWPVNALTHSVGALSLRACDPGKFGTGDSAEDWDIIASKNGVYLHLGAAFYKVAQEMSRTLGTAPTAVTWDDINWAYQHTIWVKNFVNQRFCLIGVPVGEATAPNIIFAFDYREMDTAAQIASALPIHITLTGKMKSSDMTRKWTRWNVKANCAEILVRPGNVKELFLGGGSGSTPGTGIAYGNLYSLDPARFTDDDYGAMQPYYFTYAFLDHDQEQQLQLGAGRKLFKHISSFSTGIGLITITAYVNSLLNPLPPLSPRLLTTDADQGTAQPSDLEWVTGIRGQRVFLKISVQPLPGTTDVQIKLQKLIMRVMKDPVALFRGSGV